tara:strand:- start:196 stop:1035 length:840 start_codon:yes stop_codon:yes gene_type:complete
MIIQDVINDASKKLRENKISSHIIDAELLLSNLMSVPREFLILNGNKLVTPEINNKYKKFVKRRINNEPVAYIIGKKEFWSTDFIVNKSTLVPRPETELLIYKIIKFFKNKKINVLDIGTGSGCILLSILKELVYSRGIGIDISKMTIRTAIENSKRLKVSNRVRFKAVDINEFNEGKYDLIVSNPPYIPTKDLKKLTKDIVNYEPIVALNGGKDGLDLIKKVIYKSVKLLKKNGLLAIEIGNKQYTKISNILIKNGFKEIGRECDYNKNIRCIISTKL